MARARYKIAVTAGIVAALMYVGAYRASCRMEKGPASTRETADYVLTRNRLAGYVVSEDALLRESGAGRWIRVSSAPDIRWQSELAMHASKMYYYDSGKGAVVSRGIRAGETPIVVTFEPRTTSYFAVSIDGNMLAYRVYLDDMWKEAAIATYELESGSKEFVYHYTRKDADPLNSLSWSSDNDSLLLGLDGEILKLDLATRTCRCLAQGYGVAGLDKGYFGYWRIEDGSVVFFRNEYGRIEREVFRYQRPFDRMAWDVSGRFIICTLNESRSLLAGGMNNTPHILDTETGQDYALPRMDSPAYYVSLGTVAAQGEGVVIRQFNEAHHGNE